MRLALARRILETLVSTLAAESPPMLPRGPSAAEVAALFKTDKPAPDVATVKQGVDEYRLEKCGTLKCCWTQHLNQAYAVLLSSPFFEVEAWPSLILVCSSAMPKRSPRSLPGYQT
jgi:hypothetical protein